MIVRGRKEGHREEIVPILVYAHTIPFPQGSYTSHPNNSIRRLSSVVEPPRGDSQDRTSNLRHSQCFVVMLGILGILGGVGVVDTKIGNWSRATTPISISSLI